MMEILLFAKDVRVLTSASHHNIVYSYSVRFNNSICSSEKAGNRESETSCWLTVRHEKDTTKTDS